MYTCIGYRHIGRWHFCSALWSVLTPLPLIVLYKAFGMDQLYALVTVIGLYTVYKIYCRQAKKFRVSISHIPGPSPDSFWLGMPLLYFAVSCNDQLHCRKHTRPHTSRSWSDRSPVAAWLWKCGTHQSKHGGLQQNSVPHCLHLLFIFEKRIVHGSQILRLQNKFCKRLDTITQNRLAPSQQAHCLWILVSCGLKAKGFSILNRYTLLIFKYRRRPQTSKESDTSCFRVGANKRFSAFISKQNWKGEHSASHVSSLLRICKLITKWNENLMGNMSEITINVSAWLRKATLDA